MKPLKIGITGGIGTGKSLVAKIFHTLGVPVYDADARAKWLMSNDPKLIKGIKSLLGESSFNGENQIDNRFIAKAVFVNESLLQRLNSLVHPAVGDDFENWVTQFIDNPYVLKEAALLFESGSYQTLDHIITVSSPFELRLERITIRDPFRTKDQILSIISKQLPEEDKIKKSDHVIYNDEQKMVVPQVLEIHVKYQNN